MLNDIDLSLFSHITKTYESKSESVVRFYKHMQENMSERDHVSDMIMHFVDLLRAMERITFISLISYA